MDLNEWVGYENEMVNRIEIVQYIHVFHFEIDLIEKSVQDAVEYEKTISIVELCECASGSIL